MPSREELEYSLARDPVPYVASARSRFDTPGFYAVVAHILRSMKLLQSVKAALDRPGFETYMPLIASLTSADIVETSLHESLPRTNQDLITTAGNQTVRTALMHLIFPLRQCPWPTEAKCVFTISAVR